MIRRLLLGTVFILGGAAALAPAARDDSKKEESTISWKKTVLDKAFRAEGCAVADINKDGKLDIIIGNCWYEAPNWKMHEIADNPDFDKKKYSTCFEVWTHDVNGDGWPDAVIVGFPGFGGFWRENPKGKAGKWKQHPIADRLLGESPAFVDLLGNGKKVLVCCEADKERKLNSEMAWFEPAEDPTKPWIRHAASDFKNDPKPLPPYWGHGQGILDVNGDGRLDIVTPVGWWEQPTKDPRKLWKFHHTKIGSDCAQMIPYDIKGDGKTAIISTSAHHYGMWWHEQKLDAEKNMTFVTHDLLPKLVSQTHALVCTDINGDGLPDLVTGKRYWAHGPKVDADPDKPAMLYWFEAKKDAKGRTTFIPHEIDNDSGVGVLFTVADVNGDKLPDIVIANKKGVFLFEQVRTK